MTNQERLETIVRYTELAEMCDRLGFAQAARVWRYRADVFSDVDHPVTMNLLSKERTGEVKAP